MGYWLFIMKGNNMSKQPREQKVIYTSKGDRLVLSGISPLLISKLQSVGTVPDAPTRQVKLDLEGMEPTFQEETLAEDDLQTKEEQVLWAKYTKERDEVLAKRNTGFLKAIFAKGVTVDLTNLEAWKEEQDYFGLPIPEHPIDLKVEYLQTELITNTEDMIDIITGVLGESGIPEEELESVRAMFQRSIRRNSPEQTEAASGEVAMESDLRGDEGSPLLEGVAAEQVLLS
jgi:hypothetical protein